MTTITRIIISNRKYSENYWKTNEKPRFKWTIILLKSFTNRGKSKLEKNIRIFSKIKIKYKEVNENNERIIYDANGLLVKIQYYNSIFNRFAKKALNCVKFEDHRCQNGEHLTTFRMIN